MKVLHVIPAIAPCYGGPSKVVLDTCRALRTEGIEAEIATTNADEPRNSSIPKEVPVLVEGVPVHFFERQHPWRYKFSWGLTRWLRKNTAKYDLLHVHAVFSYSTAAATFFARESSIPYIIIPHGMLSPWPVHQNWLLKQVYLRMIERKNLDCATAVHFTAEDELKMSIVCGNSNFVLPCIVNVQTNSSHARRRLDPVAPRILFLSRIDPKKGIDLLIRALSNLARAGSLFELVVAGSGERAYEAEVMSSIRASGLHSRTTIKGFVEGAEKSALLEEADIFVLPSHHENFGIAVVEAMAGGLPVIISDKVNIHDDVRQANAGLVTAPNVEDLSTALLKLLSSSALRLELGNNGRNLVRTKYSTISATDELTQIYTDILSGTCVSRAWRSRSTANARV